jgi:hypothetical protein
MSRNKSLPPAFLPRLTDAAPSVTFASWCTLQTGDRKPFGGEQNERGKARRKLVYLAALFPLLFTRVAKARYEQPLYNPPPYRHSLNPAKVAPVAQIAPSWFLRATFFASLSKNAKRIEFLNVRESRP